LSRFSDIDYNEEKQTVRIGAGLVWDDVYAALEPHGVNAPGGRISGIGVAGFTLGGGK
jgi:FAD/FMN-containing dehydrogenase